jgi:threonine synthase
MDTAQPGIWRYRSTFGLPEQAEPVSLGEGNTPLIWADAFGAPAALKCEYQNPSGSFKDRGSAVIASFLRVRGIQNALEDSSGNAGASMAAYAARAGICLRVFVPDAASGPKRTQIGAYGAEVVRVMGPRSNAADAARRAADQGMAYASHAYLPVNLTGYATAAYEIVEQLGVVPGAVLTPAGQGGLLLGMARGFDALLRAGVIKQYPRLVGVQAGACAPLWAVHRYGHAGLGWVTEGATIAEGIRVSQPLRGDAVLSALAAYDGELVAVEEEVILPAQAELAERGFYVEPTSAVVWAALKAIVKRLPQPIVAILTGSGLKWQRA